MYDAQVPIASESCAVSPQDTVGYPTVSRPASVLASMVARERAVDRRATCQPSSGVPGDVPVDSGTTNDTVMGTAATLFGPVVAHHRSVDCSLMCGVYNVFGIEVTSLC